MKKGSSFWGKLKLGFAYAWRPALLALVMAGLCYYLLWFKLGSLTNGLSNSEFITQQHMALKDITLASILKNPLYLPYNIMLFALQTVGLHGATALRSVSAVIGIAGIISFYFIIRRWHTPRLAIFGTILFSTSSWFLHTARYGSTDILYIGVLVVLISGILLQQSKKRKTMLTVVTIAAALYIYVPGMIWMVLLTGFWQRKRLASEMSHVPKWFNAFIAVLGLLLILPLAYGIFKDKSLLPSLVGLPSVMPNIGQLIQNAMNIPIYIFIKGPNDPTKWLPGTSYLDIFTSMMLIIGVYWSLFRFKLDRIKAVFGVLAIGSVLIILGGPTSMALLVAPLYILVTAGMTFMLQQWYTVFPRNPIPRSIGTILLTIAVLFSVFYNINHYFIAWPNTPSVRASFTKQPLIVN